MKRETVKVSGFGEEATENARLAKVASKRKTSSPKPNTQDSIPSTKKTAGDKQLESFEARRAELIKTGMYGNDILMIAVPLDDLGDGWTSCYITKPSRQIVSTALSLTQQGQVLQASEIILRESWIEGDEKILTEDELFYAAHVTLQGLIKFRVGILKKN